ISPAFDAAGKYLYFLASTDYGPRSGWLEMSSVDRPVRRAIYITILSAREPSPLIPEPGDEPLPPPPDEARDAQASRTKPEKASAAVNVSIDFEGIGKRIVTLKTPAGYYSELTPGSAGVIFYEELVTAGPPQALSLQKSQLKDQTAASFLEG